MNDESEIERLRKTNDELHRRIQKIEGLISKGYHGTALDVLCEQRIRTEVAFRISEHQEVKKWMHIASKHGEKNAKLQSENARLRKALREIADSDSISRYRLIEMAEKALDRPESEAKAPNVTAQELVDDVDIPKTGYVQNSKPLQYPPDLENRQLQADNARLREALGWISTLSGETCVHAGHTLDEIYAVTQTALAGPEKESEAGDDQ